MKVEVWQLWVAVGAFVQGIFLLLFGYLRKAPLVSASTMEELRKALAECRAACVEARAEATDLRMQLATMRAETVVLMTRIESLRADLEWYKDKWIQTQRRSGPNSAS